MHEETDTHLLHRFAANRAPEAFAEIVRRHIGLVYGVALRRLNGDTHSAEDITQQVFSDLARKARIVAAESELAGWLFTSSRYAAAKFVRTEQRRREREQEASRMTALQDSPEPAPVNWEILRPIMDEALEQLGAQDRAAILLRFYEGRSYGEVASRLALTDSGARMRVDRALDKLQVQLARRGLGSSVVALAAALAEHAAVAAPAGLATTVTGTALAVAGTGGVASLILTLMSTNKLAIGTGVMIAALGASGFAIQQQERVELQARVAQLEGESADLARLRSDVAQLSREAAEVAAMKNDDGVLADLDAQAALLGGRLNRAVIRAENARAARPRLSDSLDQAPSPKTQARPEYPTSLRNFGIEGEVTVSLVVDKDGVARDVAVEKSSRPEFEAPAVEAVRQWTFNPGKKGGRAVNTRITVPIRFAVSSKTPATVEVKGATVFPK
ncbi:MAG: TonB family protein [Verrucomicrobia bacterium]|nr:TonB family protein [Verrucomicrobiota bacterium]